MFQLDNNHLVGAAPVDITITNNYQGENFTFRVKPEPQAPALPLTAASSTCTDNKYNYGARTLELYKLSAKASGNGARCENTRWLRGGDVLQQRLAASSQRQHRLSDLSPDIQHCRQRHAPADGTACNVTLRNMTDPGKTAEVKVTPNIIRYPA